MSRVAVVGAGISGLAAAYALQQAGLEVAVLERSSAVGGRMHTRSEQGFTWDAGAQFMMGGYRYMRRLMEKLALPVSQHKVPSVTATMLPDGRLYYTRTGSPGGHPAASGAILPLPGEDGQSDAGGLAKPEALRLVPSGEGGSNRHGEPEGVGRPGNRAGRSRLAAQYSSFRVLLLGFPPDAVVVLSIPGVGGGPRPMERHGP